MAVHFRIVGVDLPGSSCGPSPTPTGRNDDIHVAVQRDQEMLGFVRGDAERAVFEFDVAVRNGRFTGPYVHGRGDQRFFYLAWGEGRDDAFRMFRRAKVMLEDLDPGQVDGRTVEARLGLTDPKGHPTCAAVRAPQVTWTVT